MSWALSCISEYKAANQQVTITDIALHASHHHITRFSASPTLPPTLVRRPARDTPTSQDDNIEARSTFSRENPYHHYTLNGQSFLLPTATAVPLSASSEPSWRMYGPLPIGTDKSHSPPLLLPACLSQFFFSFFPPMLCEGSESNTVLLSFPYSRL